MNFLFSEQESVNKLYTVAFYNLENLFDTVLDTDTLDTDFTPNGIRQWTPTRYKKKLKGLARTIKEIGLDSSGRPPVLIGIAEVENGAVVRDLLETPPLKAYNYDYIHYESPDERGIDTALIYHRDYFRTIDSKPIPLIVQNGNGDRDTTRDILYVEGVLNGETVHIFVNHWPSRRTGDEETDYKRIEAARTIISCMEVIEESLPDPNYIVMGDFNDGPTATSIQTLMGSDKLFNPIETLHSPTRGSATYRRSWNLFDQIMVSHNFLIYGKGTHSFAHADIFDVPFLVETKGRYKGNPYRTYVGGKYKGGYSDHFPVYIQLKLNS
jgi:endonuclease/exonuclease/phosphatase family metal-dependent hydrolase